MHVNIPYPLACKTTFLMDEGLLSISPACCGQLVKILINLEPYWIFGSNFAYLFILIMSKAVTRVCEHHFGQSRVSGWGGGGSGIHYSLKI